MNQRIIVESLSMDLLRVALGMHRRSFAMAERFKEEALKRESELQKMPIEPKLKKLIDQSQKSLLQNNYKMAEDILMFSILFRNYAQKYFENN